VAAADAPGGTARRACCVCGRAFRVRGVDAGCPGVSRFMVGAPPAPRVGAGRPARADRGHVCRKRAALAGVCSVAALDSELNCGVSSANAFRGELEDAPRAKRKWKITN